MRSFGARWYHWLQTTLIPSELYVPSEIMMPKLLTLFLSAVYFEGFPLIVYYFSVLPSIVGPKQHKFQVYHMFQVKA